MNALCLIACCKTKDARASTARGLYQSDLFRKAVAYAESIGCNWYVLSAQYGLLAPDDAVAPYERTLADLSPPEIARWERAVVERVDAALSASAPLILLAGARYRRCLEVAFPDRCVSPLQGLEIGNSKRWLKENLGRPPLAL